METTDYNTPSAAKWFDKMESDGSDSDPVGLVPHNRGYKLKRWAADRDHFGGSKLRAPQTMSEQIDLVKNGKNRSVIKRRKRRFDEDFSDEEEDPYTQVKVEDILSPIETPSDIVRRPTLRRILKSPQMELLANTSMEFIESEKTFNKILSRLSSILYCDDPQYVDVTYERTTESQNGEFSMDVDAKSDDKGHKSSPESVHAGRNGHKGDAVADEEARLILVRVRELLQENINFSNEYLNRLRSARAKLTRTNTQKKQLWKRLKMKAIEQERKRIQHMQQQAQRETNGAASVLSSLARNTSPGPSGLNLSYT
ncbi:hypothetical protein BC943DRAFT_320210 [Umbelopsis sp. AD052]|nr:hypothetical protein BC943DRAFT_320210 [Umbelopsis sp. AD052]